MKKFILSLVVLAVSATTTFAQCPKQGKKCDNPKACAEKVVKCADRLVQEMKLDDATAQWFKPLFAEYQQKLKDTRAKYACKKDKKDCSQCTDAEILQQLENKIKCQEDIAGVKGTYLKKFKAKLNAKQLKVIFCEKGKAHQGKRHMMGKHGMKHGKKHGMKAGKCGKMQKCDKAQKCDKPCDKKCDAPKCDKAQKCDAPKCDKAKK